MKEKLKNLDRNLVNTVLKNKIILDEKGSLKKANIKINIRKINSSKNDKIKFKNAVNEFLSTLNKKSKNFNSTFLLDNFKKTNFDINIPLSNAKFLSDNEKIKIAGGICSTHKNYISYYALLNSIYHELMHLSSSKVSGEIFLSGLSVRGGEVKYGIGINEAYTQYLTERYFKGKCSKTYRLETQMIKPFEIIVGKDKLEGCYFNADLVTVLNELGKYSTKDQINSFVENYDELLELDYSNIKGTGKLTIRKLRMQELIKNIYLFYLNTLKNKVLTFDRYNLTDENVMNILYLLDRSNWVKTIENEYYTLNESIFEEVSQEIQDYLSFEESKKIS